MEDEYDDGFDFEDPDFYSQMDAMSVLVPTPILPPRVTIPTLNRPKSTVVPPIPIPIPRATQQPALRPAQPPIRKAINKQQVGNAAGKNYVNPNPFHHKVVQSKRVELEDLDEEMEMPHIVVEDSGNYRTGISASVATSAPAGVQKQGGTNGHVPRIGNEIGKESSSTKGLAPISESRGRETAPLAPVLSDQSRARIALADKEREELLALRAKYSDLETLLKDQKRASVAHYGAETIARSKLTKKEEELRVHIEESRKEKEKLKLELDMKDKEFKRELDTFKVRSAFERQEQETSVRKAPSSAYRNRSNSLAENTQYHGNGRMGPPPPPNQSMRSPSAGRGKIGSKNSLPSIPPTPAAVVPSFPGFQNSFGPTSTTRATISKRNRALLSTSPTAGTKQKAGNSVKKGRYIAGMDVHEEEEEEENPSAFSKEKGNEVVGMDLAQGEMEIDSEEEREGDLEGEEPRENIDWKGDIISTIFAHTTFVQYDVESVLHPSGSATNTQRMSVGSNSTTYRSTALFRDSSSSTSRQSTSLRGEATSIPGGKPQEPEPTPTIHYLTNLRLPLKTDPTIVVDYEKSCRDLFASLGSKSSRSRRGEFDEDESELELHTFVRGIAGSLEKMVKLLEKAGSLGPLISLLSLLSSLILLFPPFVLYFLSSPHVINNSDSSLLTSLARIIVKFGKPSPLLKLNLETTSNGKGKAKERSRRARGTTGRKVGRKLEEGDRVEVGAGIRDALVLGILEVFEGLAYKMRDGEEDVFVDVLNTKDTVACLLDRGQTLSVLTGTVSWLSLLLINPRMFRAVAGIVLQELAATDSRTGSHILNRMATLTAHKDLTASIRQTIALDMSIISFVNIFLLKHEDAILLAIGSTALVPHILLKIFQDVKTLWEYDGDEISDATLKHLRTLLVRLNSFVHFIYFLACSPTSTFNRAEFFRKSTSHGLSDRFNVAFGTLSFAALPSWAEGTPEGSQLIELQYIALDVMDDVSPREAEEMESCFNILDPEMEDIADDMQVDEVREDEEELALRELEAQTADSMQVEA